MSGNDPGKTAAKAGVAIIGFGCAVVWLPVAAFILWFLWKVVL